MDTSPLERITVKFDRGSYPVVVGSGALSCAELRLRTEGRRVFVVSSAPICHLHGSKLNSALASAGRVEWLEVDDGERAKRIDVASGLWNQLLELGGKRDSVVVAFGGGSVGDLAGFVASTFLRGVEFIQIPTTLLAQVDASVGGKVAIDLELGKNTVGSFYQPSLVIADTGLLQTLPVRDVRSGFVESLKMGLLLDESLADKVERILPKIQVGEVPLLATTEATAEVVAHSVRVKASVVESDPYESGDRKLLNFGHTLGHAIEACLGFEQLRHGEAVAYGMLFAAQLSRQFGLDDSGVERIQRAVADLELPSLPALDPSELLDACYRDKKATEGALTWVLCPSIGCGLLVDSLTRPRVAAALQEFLQG